MSVEIKVPQLGESIVEATVGRWLKHEGDPVETGEALVELETDKVNQEIVSPADGVLQSIVKGEGENVGIGETLGTVGDNGATARPASEAPSSQSAAPPSPAPAVAPPPQTSEEAASGGEDGARSTPLARRIAAEHGIDINEVKGTGPSGRVTKDDVTAHIERQGQAPPAPAPPLAPARVPGPAQPQAAPPAPSTAAGRSEERVRMSRRRQTIARRLVEAQHTAAMLTTFNEVDMSAIMDLRKRRGPVFQERHGVKLGFMSFFTRAAIGGLKAFPELNAEIQGDEMVLKRYYDIGIAVSTEEGLVVPVVRDADRKSFADLEREIGELARKARDRQLSLEELQGGTFTITNGGIFGSLLSTPILNAPQVGILGMHKIQERPVAIDGEVVVRPMMYLAVSYDHRIVDGRESVQFLVRIKELLEDPERLLLEG